MIYYYKSKYEKFDVLKSNVSTVGPFVREKHGEGPTLETLDFTIRIGSTSTFSYFDLYLYSAYACSTLRLYIITSAKRLCFYLCLFVCLFSPCLFVCLSPEYLIKYYTNVHVSLWKGWS